MEDLDSHESSVFEEEEQDVDPFHEEGINLGDENILEAGSDIDRLKLASDVAEKARELRR